MSELPAAVIAVASGKGGTGKTTVAAHLALSSARSRRTALIDLDVEAPDVLGYFPEAAPVKAADPVTVAVPHLIEAQCDGCALCSKSCHFGAIIVIGGVVTIDERICKGCGRCAAVCPHKALTEVDFEVGTISSYRRADLDILEGRVSVGDIRSTAVIEAVKRQALKTDSAVQVRDCPPGVSCPAAHAIEGADFVVLVAEPTEFSLHDLGAALELVHGRGIPAGVVINKDGFGTADVDGYCRMRGIPVIGRIGFDRKKAASGASGRLWEDDIDFMHEMEGILEAALKRSRPGDGGRV